MNETVFLSADQRSVTIRIPLKHRRRGGRKLVVLPDGTEADGLPSPARPDAALVKALGRAFRWRKLLESGVYATLQELAAAERINSSYVARILRLTYLSPAIVTGILDGRRPDLTLPILLKPFPLIWEEQTRMAADKR